MQVNVDDIKMRWEPNHTYQLLKEGGQVCDQVFVGNVTGDALRGIADFIGETLADGNVLSGEAPQIPFVIKMFEQRLVAAWLEHCVPVSPELPSPVNDEWAKAVPATLYVWMRFQRLRGQSWEFIKDGTLCWETLNAPLKDDEDVSVD